MALKEKVRFLMLTFSLITPALAPPDSVPSPTLLLSLPDAVPSLF